MNDLIREVAVSEKLPLLDIYARFVKETELQGPHLLTMRCRELKSIPERLRGLIPKQSLLWETGVYVMTTRSTPISGKCPVGSMTDIRTSPVTA